MDEDLSISLDKLPVKRLEVIEENGAERFPPDLSYDDNRVNLFRRIDFAWVVEREDLNKKQKKDDTTASSSSKDASSSPWPWQNMIENLQLAHQELSVIIDLINTHLAREARFYGSLTRHRMAATAAGNEGFYIDLFDNTLFDPKSVFRLSSLSTVRVEHDSAGMLALNLSSKACHTLQFGFVNEKTNNIMKGSNRNNSEFSGENNDAESDDESVKKRHSDLREVHRAVFDEQVFNLMNQEAFVLSLGVNVTGIRENHLKLNIDQEASVFISLVTSSSTEDDATHSFEEDLARSVSYVRLMSHPTRHSCTSTWTLVVDVHQSILHTSSYMASSSQFLTKVVVNDDCINIEGEGAPNVVGLFKGNSENSYSINRFECNLADLHVILLQQVASQIIRWLHEEALTVGMKVSRDFLSLSFEVGQGEMVGLVAQVDPEQSDGGMSWWLVLKIIL
ncbi:hypothetical protein L1987_20877 [Smallanthus sonchifolius]|uniref:Uncharacterized protein n=1 Tax=Smallanthus sonchifolius TaxID=185202 RepID=A0ACB9IUW2_9ASTR|nr:hypothetical protein L1987_20877 [Smallanthus sonchifolius]